MITRLLIFAVRVYQRLISPLFPRTCRYNPTCSAYAVQALTEYGALKGGWIALRRILRCHPFSRHDYYDPLP